MSEAKYAGMRLRDRRIDAALKRAQARDAKPHKRLRLTKLGLLCLRVRQAQADRLSMKTHLSTINVEYNGATGFFDTAIKHLPEGKTEEQTWTRSCLSLVEVVAFIEEFRLKCTR